MKYTHEIVTYECPNPYCQRIHRRYIRTRARFAHECECGCEKMLFPAMWPPERFARVEVVTQ